MNALTNYPDVKMSTIKIAEYTEYPGLRHCTISEHSGEDYYHKILNSAFAKAVERKKPLTAVLDGVDGYAPSFLDEAFGNLVYDFSLAIVSSLLVIISVEEPHWKVMIEKDTYTKWEDRRLDGNAPKITGNHSPWYRYRDNKLEIGKWE